MNAMKSLNHRTVLLKRETTQVVVAVALLLLEFARQCNGQGTMLFAFEGQPRGTTSDPREYSESGMHFGALGAEGMLRVGGGIASRPENGTAYLQATLHANLGFGFFTFPSTWFSFLSFDLGEYDTGYPGTATVQVIGYGGQGVRYTNVFTTDGINDGTGPLQDFQTFYPDSQFAQVYRVDILTGHFSIDNVVIGGVPEPSAGGLILLGTLLGLGGGCLKSRRPSGLGSAAAGG